MFCCPCQRRLRSSLFLSLVLSLSIYLSIILLGGGGQWESKLAIGSVGLCIFFTLFTGPGNGRGIKQSQAIDSSSSSSVSLVWIPFFFFFFTCFKFPWRMRKRVWDWGGKVMQDVVFAFFQWGEEALVADK